MIKSMSFCSGQLPMEAGRIEEKVSQLKNYSNITYFFGEKIHLFFMFNINANKMSWKLKIFHFDP